MHGAVGDARKRGHYAAINASRGYDCPGCGGVGATDSETVCGECDGSGKAATNSTPGLQVEADAATQLAQLREEIRKVRALARECRGLVSKYSRAYGENGDRVADLLSADTYRIGEAILATLDDILGEEFR